MRYTELIQKLFNAVGLEVARFSTSPRRTLLGLRQFPFRTVLDIGANTGQFARYITIVFPKARVFCFEPLSEPFEKLQRWASSFHQRNIIPINTALGDYEGEVKMFHHVEHSPSSSLLAASTLTADIYPQTRKQQVQVVLLQTLDKVVSNHSIRIVPDVLIKMDVQGYEDRVIRGGSKIFSSAKACLLEINLETLYECQALFKELVLLLDYHGLRYRGNFHQTYHRDGHVLFVDAVFVHD